MLENQGNPESGIDQFLAQQAPAEPTIEELKSKVEKLEQELSWARKSRDNYLDTCNKATSYIQASIDNGDWTDEELSEIFWEELAEILDLEMLKTYEVIIKAEWSATLKGPRNMSVSDMADYISLEEPTVSRYNSVEIDDIYEREVDITEA